MTVPQNSPGLEFSTSQQESDRKRNAYRVSLITALLMGSIAILSAIITVVLKEYSFYGAIATGILSLIAFISFWLVRQGRDAAGIIVLSAGIMLAGMGLTIFARVPIVGLAVFLMVSGIAVYSLPENWAGWMTGVSFLAGVATVILGMYGPSLALLTNMSVTNIAVGVLTVIYILFIAFRFSSFSVRVKLVLFTLIVVQVPMAVLTYLIVSRQTTHLQEDLETQLLSTAEQAAANLEGFVAERRIAILGEAQIPDIIAYLQMSPQARINTDQVEKTSSVLITYRTKDVAYTLSYALLDPVSGKVLIDTDVSNIGKSEADFSYFQKPVESGFPYVSPIEYTGEAQKPQFSIGAPVFNANGKVIGVLRVRYNAYVLQDRLENALANEQESIYGVLVDKDYLIRVAHTGDPSLMEKTYLALDSAVITQLQKTKRLPGNVLPEDLMDHHPEVVAGLNNLDNAAVFQVNSDLPSREQEYVGAARIKNTDWIVMVHEPTALISEQITEQANASTMVSMIATGIALLAAIGVSEVFARPIRRLTATAQEIANGNLNARAKIQSRDEMGLLAGTFDAMTEQLRETLEGLEQRVQERTADVERASAESQKRADQLQVISEVARVIASEQDMEKLLPLITNLVSERFGFYHVGIFLNDESDGYAKLRAANSEGGQQMLARGHRLRVGQEGIVGYVTGAGQARIALDVGEDAVFFNNPDLPQTRSEMALPLIVRDRIIGALDVQSTIPNAFTAADANILRTLADQVAIAIENARLYGESNRALAEIQTLNRQYLAEKWQGIVQAQPVIGFHKDQKEIKPLTEPVEWNEVKQAVETGNVAMSTHLEKNPIKSVAIPISVRGEIVGVLDVRTTAAERQWSQREVVLLKAVAERVGTALETARLFENAQKQANKERVIGEISTKIGASVAFQNILHTAVEELGHAIPGSDVLIQLRQEYKDETGDGTNTAS